MVTSILQKLPAIGISSYKTLPKIRRKTELLRKNEAKTLLQNSYDISKCSRSLECDSGH
jgi:hypothetical protein